MQATPKQRLRLQTKRFVKNITKQHFTGRIEMKQTHANYFCSRAVTTRVPHAAAMQHTDAC